MLTRTFPTGSDGMTERIHATDIFIYMVTKKVMSISLFKRISINSCEDSKKTINFEMFKY